MLILFLPSINIRQIKQFIRDCAFIFLALNFLLFRFRGTFSVGIGSCKRFWGILRHMNKKGKLCDPHEPIELWFQMMRTHRAIDRALSAVAASEDLTIPQTEILAILNKKGPQPQQTLAANLCVTKGNVAQVIDRLHRAGLLVRKEIAGNRRANQLAITPLGVEKIRRIQPKFEAFLTALFASHLPERRAALLADMALMEQSASGMC
jgi:DNA-binding MarR family transcriptional regulator